MNYIIPSIGLAKAISRFVKVTFAALRTSLPHIRAKGGLTTQDEETVDKVAIDNRIFEGICKADCTKF